MIRANDENIDSFKWKREIFSHFFSQIFFTRILMNYVYIHKELRSSRELLQKKKKILCARLF